MRNATLKITIKDDVKIALLIFVLLFVLLSSEPVVPSSVVPSSVVPSSGGARGCFPAIFGLTIAAMMAKFF